MGHVGWDGTKHACLLHVVPIMVKERGIRQVNKARAVLICSMVAAAMAVPPVAAALATASAIPLGSMGKWINSLLKNYENAIKGQKENISSMTITHA
ncbi:UPF0496 protein-like protein [Tanacetum coccineum]